MAMTSAAVCDCGLPRILNRQGILRCSHCDTSGCSGHCTRCTQYAAGIVRRVILRAYEGGSP